MHQYDGNQLWLTAAQLQGLTQAAQTLQNINRDIMQILSRLTRSTLHDGQYSQLCDRLGDFASSMNSVLKMCELLITGCAEEGPSEIVAQIRFECERHPLADRKDEPSAVNENFISGQWREQVESLLLLVLPVLERLLRRPRFNSKHLRSLTKLANALHRQEQHLQKLQPRKPPNIRVEMEECPICTRENAKLTGRDLTLEV